MKKSLIVVSLGLSAVLMSGAYAQHGHGHAHGHAVSTQVSSEKGTRNVAIDQCWIRLMPSGTPSGGFFNLKNNDASQIAVLKAIETDAFEEVMLHRSYTRDGQSGMEMVPEVIVKAGETLHFEPGGFHAMLEKPVSGLKAGDKIQAVFILGTGDKLPVTCELKPINARSFDS
ncbi:copper chaperone PCu(A)C [Advenella sp. RU8]|uniref:copper chaperone PCu(A)C n=1 Tax=Advenella sp. RU8 TaxID=3399575 RepID=UPI003AAE15D4